MRINFTARHYKPSQRLKEYAQNEVKRLEKIYRGIVDCDIVLDYQKDMQIAEINVGVHGTQLTSVEKTEDIYGMLSIQLLDTGQHMGTKEIVKYYMHEIEEREFLYLGNMQSNSTKM